MRIIPTSHPLVAGKREFDIAVPEMKVLASHVSGEDSIVEVNLVGEKRMAWLNRKFRSRRGPPEILTFVYGQGKDAGPADDSPAGEIYLCWRSIAKGASTRGVEVRLYLLRLFVHGLFHLAGYRHDSPAGEMEMEGAERRFIEEFIGAGEAGLLFD